MIPHAKPTEIFALEVPVGYTSALIPRVLHPKRIKNCEHFQLLSFLSTAELYIALAPEEERREGRI